MIISGYYTFNFAFDSKCTRKNPRIGNLMDFTPEVEDEVIRDSVSQKLDRPLFNPSNKVWTDSTQT